MILYKCESVKVGTKYVSECVCVCLNVFSYVSVYDYTYLQKCVSAHICECTYMMCSRQVCM